MDLTSISHLLTNHLALRILAKFALDLSITSPMEFVTWKHLIILFKIAHWHNICIVIKHIPCNKISCQGLYPQKNMHFQKGFEACHFRWKPLSPLDKAKLVAQKVINCIWNHILTYLLVMEHPSKYCVHNVVNVKVLVAWRNVIIPNLDLVSEKSLVNKH